MRQARRHPPDAIYGYDPLAHRYGHGRHGPQSYRQGLCRDCTPPDRRLHRLEGSLAQAPILCPRCQRLWVYRVNTELEVRRRSVFCTIACFQPFLMSPLPQGRTTELKKEKR